MKKINVIASISAVLIITMIGVAGVMAYHFMGQQKAVEPMKNGALENAYNPYAPASESSQKTTGATKFADTKKDDLMEVQDQLQTVAKDDGGVSDLNSIKAEAASL